jgi:hypothetical protein
MRIDIIRDLARRAWALVALIASRVALADEQLAE